jgi:hypothetical protein
VRSLGTERLNMSDEKVTGSPNPGELPVDTATPESVDTAQATATEQEERKFTQAELDDIVAKRLAREKRAQERKAQTEQIAARANLPVDVAIELESRKPDRANYSSDSDYVDALAEYKASILVAQKEHKTSVKDTYSSFADKESEAYDKYKDYDEVAHNPDLPVPEFVAEAIVAAQNGPDILYYLGKNPEEARRIAGLKSPQQALEIGILSETLSKPNQGKGKKLTTAPPPISPIGSPTVAKVLDLTDPKALQQMGQKEWIKARNEAERAKQQRKRAGLSS